MERVDFQLEELSVSEPVGLSLHGLDLVIHTFQRAGGDGMAEPVQNAKQTGGQRASELLYHSNAGLHRLLIPGGDEVSRRRAVRLLP